MNDDEAGTPFQGNGDMAGRPAPDEPSASGSGTIRSFLAEKGFGFIARYGEPDVFFHVTDLVDGQVAVEIGQKVRFELQPSARKPGAFVAVRVQRYDS